MSDNLSFQDLYADSVACIGKSDKISEATKAKIRMLQEQKDKKQAVIADYAKDNSIVHQLIDLALLQNGMLKGEALDKFLKRSIELIK